MVLRPAEVAILILICSGYAIQPISHLIGLDTVEPVYKQTFDKLLSILLIGIVTYINIRSVKLFVTINNFCSFGKVVACLIVIVGGVMQLCMGNVDNLKSGFEGTTSNPGHIALAFFNGLWAYDGWVSVTLVTEEVKRPEK